MNWPPSDSISPIDDAAQHGARDVADAAQHRGGEGPQPCGVADDEAGEVVVEPEDQPGRTGQRGAEEEGDHDDPVDLDAHHARRLLVLGGRLHRLAHLGVPHEEVQSAHQDEGDDPDQHLAQSGAPRRRSASVSLGIGFGKFFESAPTVSRMTLNRM